jgi:hypothetical protein
MNIGYETQYPRNKPILSFVTNVCSMNIGYETQYRFVLGRNIIAFTFI